MRAIPFKIFPSIGYINSQFQIINLIDNEIRIDVIKEGIEIKKLELSSNSSSYLLELALPGKYELTTCINNIIFSQYLEIKNSIRIGTSIIKKIYTFNKIPYTYILMKDRILIYNEKNKVTIIENEISPSEIIKINEEILLFKTTFKDSNNRITNFGIYQVNEYKISWELTDTYTEIEYISNLKRLWVYDNELKKIKCFHLSKSIEGQPKELLTINNVNNYDCKSIKNTILLIEKNKITIINITNLNVKEYKISPDIAIDYLGSIYYKNKYSLTLENFFEVEVKHKIHINDDFIYNKEKFIFIGDNYITKPTVDLELTKLDAIREFRPDSETKFKFKQIDLKEIRKIEIKTVSKSFYYSTREIIIVTQINTKTISHINYSKNVFEWTGSTVINEKNEYKIQIATSITLKDLKINLLECTFNIDSLTILNWKISSNTYLLYYRGNSKVVAADSIKIYENFNGNNYVLINNCQYKLYDVLNLETPIFITTNIINENYICEHKTIWYEDEINTIQNATNIAIKGFNLESKTIIDIRDENNNQIVNKLNIFTQREYLKAPEILINPENGKLKKYTTGLIMSSSNDLTKVIIRRSHKIYLLMYCLDRKRYIEDEIQIEQDNYKESHLSPNGNFLTLLNASNEYILYDIRTNERIKYFSEKFIAFSRDGNLIFEDDKTKNPKIIDPITFNNITPNNYHFYQYLSPDAKLYSQLSTQFQYRDRLTNALIDEIQYNYLINLTKPPLPISSKEIIDDWSRSMNSFFNLNKESLNLFKVLDVQMLVNFTLAIREKFIEIGIVGTSVTSRLVAPLDLSYFNYLSFSYDNCYVVYVGKPSVYGLIHLFKINFDPVKLTLEIIDNYISRIPNKAAWVCGFSKKGIFATYDSTPDTYSVKIIDSLFTENMRLEDYRRIIYTDVDPIANPHNKWKKLNGKNFLCFSPSGDYMALSEQGYEPKTLGGSGHVESGALHIVLMETDQIIKSFIEHGAPIKSELSQNNKNISFVAFSEDESKIMSLSDDGVVIVRNVDLSSFYNENIPESSIHHTVSS